ncbi:cytochrome P450 4c21-like [Anticarsia gemmatalis]|uniref:cytochrome P450 4c21-like n=1 Tax=Anticarsia gemmatalis TaxID=129554 RepID=UPI003F757535
MYVVVILCGIACVYSIYSRWRRNARAPKMPPAYPGALPLIGHTHLLLLWSRDLFGLLTSMSNFCLKSGGVTCGYFAGQTYYGIVDPEDAVTVSNTLMFKHYLYKVAEPWLGLGLITSSGALYKHHRRLLIPAFSLPVLYGFLDVFNEQSRRLVEMLDSYVGRGPFDPVMIFRNITLRSSCITVFGDVDEKDNDFITKYAETVDQVLDIMMERLKKVWLHNEFIFGLTSIKKKQDNLLKHLDEISYEVIQRKRIDLKNKANLGTLSETEDPQRPLIDVMLELSSDGALTDTEIRDELNTTVAASFETTSQQLSFIAVYLGSYPEVQDKIYHEVMEVVGDRDVEKQDLSQLVYTEAVIKECLRMIPAIPLIPRYVDKEVKLKNYTLRANTHVFFMPLGIHRHPSWGPDVEEFKPERWLNKETQAHLANLNFSFSFGARSCIGRKYAMVSIKIALVHLVRQFRLKADHTKMKLKIDMVTRPASGHEIEVQRRIPKYDENQNVPDVFEDSSSFII